MQGSKAKYTQKQKRQAEHIAKGYQEKGFSAREAKRRAWATVNKATGGGLKSGSGRKKTQKELTARKRSVAKSAASTRKRHPRKAAPKRTTASRRSTPRRSLSPQRKTSRKSSSSPRSPARRSAAHRRK
jgi:hypothetical protein